MVEFVPIDAEASALPRMRQQPRAEFRPERSRAAATLAGFSARLCALIHPAELTYP
jgi:hypothetical protein